MKKFMTMIALSLLSSAAAQNIIPATQTFPGEAAGMLTLKGCAADAPTTVRCEYAMKVNLADDTLYLRGERFRIILPDGRETAASGFRIGGTGVYQNNFIMTARQGITYALSARFEGLPANLTSLHYLDVAGLTSEDSAPQVTYRMLSVPVKRAAAPAFVPAPAINVVGGRYTGALTRCTPGAAGTLTCTATLTPRR